jgi:hypothetical protein
MGYRPIDTRWLYSEGTAILWKAEESSRISVDQGKCGSKCDRSSLEPENSF